MGSKRINLSHIETIAHQLAVATMNWDEPIPPYRTRYPNVLESCVNVPFQTHNRKDLYPNLHAKAAILFYLLIKNHPFQNGNKRIAVTTTLVFLFLNNEWMTIHPQKLPLSTKNRYAAAQVVRMTQIFSGIELLCQKYCILIPSAFPKQKGTARACVPQD